MTPRKGSRKLNWGSVMGMAVPAGVLGPREPSGNCIRAAIWELGAGTAGTEYQVAVDWLPAGRPRLSCIRGPSGRKARLWAPGSPESEPQTMMSCRLVEGVIGLASGTGSGLAWQKGAFRPMATA